MAPRKPKPVHMPLHGVIEGGRLHGWRYAFLSFQLRDKPVDKLGSTHELIVLARCSAPNWPFPCEIPLRGQDHYGVLRAVPGERAKRALAAPLIHNAYRAAGVELPTYWADQLPRTE